MRCLSQVERNLFRLLVDIDPFFRQIEVEISHFIPRQVLRVDVRRSAVRRLVHRTGCFLDKRSVACVAHLIQIRV